MMPYYGMPVGTEYEEVGFGFNKSVLTGLLRERYGFDGIVCTDWGLVQRRRDLRPAVPGARVGRRAPHAAERMAQDPRRRRRPVRRRGVPRARSSTLVAERARSRRSGSTSRRAACCARSSRSASSTNPLRRRRRGRRDRRLGEFRAAGRRGAARVDHRARPNRRRMPAADAAVRRGAKLYVEGIAPEVAAEYGDGRRDPAEADVAILRLQAPFEQRDDDVRELLPRRLARLPAPR